MAAEKFGKCGPVSRRAATSPRPGGAAVAAFLRRLYPIKTAASVEACEGIPADTFRKWEQGCAPSYARFLRLLARHGPELICAVMPDPPDWASAAARERKQLELETAIAAKRRELEALLAS